MAEGYGEACVNSWFELSKSDYAKVIFCEISPYDRNAGAGCRFQITDNVHEDPSDYVGLFRVGWENLSESIVSKLLSNIECEDDGKILHCHFNGNEIPELEDGFYQFLYITRDNEVCGASTPFSVDKTLKCDSSDDDIVADKTEDDFLVVRSQLFEKNHMLEKKLEQCQGKIRSLGIERVKLLALIKEVSNENQRLHKSKEVDTATLSSATAELESLKTVLASNKASFLDYDAVHRELSSKISDLEKRVADEAMEVASLEEKNKQLLKQKKQLEKFTNDQKTAIMTQKATDCEYNASLIQQLENTKAMLRASEESKQLAMLEIKKFRSGAEVDNDLRCQNFALKLQLEDETKHSAELEDKLKNLKTELVGLSKAKEDLLALELQCTKDKFNESENHKEETDNETENEEIQRLLDVVNDFDNEIYELRRKLNEKDNALAKMSDKVNDLTSNCSLWEDEVSDLKSHCDQLNQDIRDKQLLFEKLKEDCLKKEAVIEYLTNEKTQLLKTQTIMHETINEMTARLKEAAELYKKQYLQINSLKKMRKHDSASKVPEPGERKKKEKKNKERNSCQLAQTQPLQSLALLKVPVVQQGFRRANERVMTMYDTTLAVKCPKPLGASPSSSEYSAAQSSDSDTGEHVRGATSQNQNKLEERFQATFSPETNLLYSKRNKVAYLYSREMASAPAAESNVESGSADENTSAKSEALHQLIEQNLANLSASGPVTKPVKDVPAKRYTLPCTICESSINVLPHNTDDMVEHLEKVHQQQMCPICGRLFDMSLPHKYFVFHVEDHYNGRKPALF